MPMAWHGRCIRWTIAQTAHLVVQLAAFSALEPHPNNEPPAQRATQGSGMMGDNCEKTGHDVVVQGVSPVKVTALWYLRARVGIWWRRGQDITHPAEASGS